MHDDEISALTRIPRQHIDSRRRGQRRDYKGRTDYACCTGYAGSTDCSGYACRRGGKKPLHSTQLCLVTVKNLKHGLSFVEFVLVDRFIDFAQRDDGPRRIRHRQQHPER